MKTNNWIWKGWLLAVGLAAVVLAACNNGEDDDSAAFDIRYPDRSTLIGSYEGTWSYSGPGFIVYPWFKSDKVDDGDHEGTILESLTATDTVTLTGDSIKFKYFATQMLMNMFVYEMYKSEFNSPAEWPVYFFGALENTPLKIHVTRLGHSDDSVYLMFDNLSYTFPAFIGPMEFTMSVDMHAASVCVINYTTRLIVADFEVEKMRAEGLEPGRLGSIGSEFELAFSLPRLIRFTAKF